MLLCLFHYFWTLTQCPFVLECAEMSFLVLMLNPGVVSSADRRVLHVVGVVCVLGFTTSLVHLPGLGPLPEVVPSEFRGRALLSVSDASSIKVSQIPMFIVRVGTNVMLFAGLIVLCVPLCFLRLLAPGKLSASPSAQCRQFSTSFPDFPRCTLMWVWQSTIGCML